MASRSAVPSRKTPYLLMLIAVVLLALYDGASGLIPEKNPIYKIMLFRSVAAAAAVAIVETYLHGSPFKLGRHYKAIGFPIWHTIQAVCFMVSAIAFLKAFQREGIALTYIVTFTNTLWVIGLGYLLLKRSLPGLWPFLALAAAFAGVVVISISRTSTLADTTFLFAGLLAGAAYGAELVFAEIAQKRHQTASRDVVFYAVMITAVCSVAIYFALGGGFQFDRSAILIGATSFLSVGASYAMFSAVEKGARLEPAIGSDKIAPLDYTILLFGLVSDFALCGLANVDRVCKKLIETNWFVFGLGALILLGGIWFFVTWGLGQGEGEDR